MAQPAATKPSDVVAGFVRWLTADPALMSAAQTIAAWIPSVEPARPRMPAVYVSLAGFPDARESVNGRGGVRYRRYSVVVDVWWSITSSDPTGDQAAAADIVERILDRLVSDPTWDGVVIHSGANVDVQIADDTYADLLAGRGILAWRITFDADRHPIAT